MSASGGPSIRHPFSGAIYALQEDGNVRISGDGGEGVFRPDGRWVSGELREADPQMCVWISNQSPPPEQLESSLLVTQEGAERS
ncbi:MAG: hypothetical protein OXP09_05265 [Gammaproteobacteria bacterium]|nr:hypothetical protein [Gammaproteobacteria bacterium]MDE0364966.1 hypothetical protein [Gammaproteobacteria bacterium]